jgi:hypothetical protein
MMYTLSKKIFWPISPDSERNPHSNDFNTNRNPDTLENKRCIGRQDDIEVFTGGLAFIEEEINRAAVVYDAGGS